MAVVVVDEKIQIGPAVNKPFIVPENTPPPFAHAFETQRFDVVRVNDQFHAKTISAVKPASHNGMFEQEMGDLSSRMIPRR